LGRAHLRLDSGTTGSRSAPPTPARSLEGHASGGLAVHGSSLRARHDRDRRKSPPPAVEFAPQVVAEEDRGTYVTRKVVLNLTGDSRVLAYITVPKGADPFPAVLCLHDHGARFDIGKEKRIRPFADIAERMASAHEWVGKYYGGRWLGDELGKRGYVCFSHDALNWSDRGGAGYEGQQALAGNLLHLGTSLAGTIAHEDLRAAEFRRRARRWTRGAWRRWDSRGAASARGK